MLSLSENNTLGNVDVPLRRVPANTVAIEKK